MGRRIANFPFSLTARQRKVPAARGCHSGLPARGRRAQLPLEHSSSQSSPPGRRRRSGLLQQSPRSRRGAARTLASAFSSMEDYGVFFTRSGAPRRSGRVTGTPRDPLRRSRVVIRLSATHLGVRQWPGDDLARQWPEPHNPDPVVPRKRVFVSPRAVTARRAI